MNKIKITSTSLFCLIVIR